MADQSGKDVLLQVLESVQAMQSQMRGFQASIDRLERKLDNTNGTLTLVGRVVNQLAVTLDDKVQDFGKRIEALEAHE